MAHVENALLHESEVPDPASATDDEMVRFAHSFDAYTVFGGFKPVLEVVLSLRSHARENRAFPRSLTVLRAGLFGEVRSERQADLEGEDLRAQRQYERGLLGSVRELVTAGEVDEEEITAVRWLLENDAITEPSPEACSEDDGFVRLEEPLDGELLGPAVHLTARILGVELQGNPSAVSEELLRRSLICAIKHLSHAVVLREHKVPVPGFQGVGPVDVVLLRDVAGAPRSLIECKWSRENQRNKIYEGVWDAIKLALAANVDPGADAFLLTAASEGCWPGNDTPELFATGFVPTREAWRRPLQPPGVNGGTTVGEDCLAGGRGNRFTHAPEHLDIDHLTDAHVSGTTLTLRLAQIRGAGQLIEFAEAPEFPERINQTWLDHNVPSMSEDQFQRLADWLSNKRWTEEELRTRVDPLRTPKER